MSKAVSGDSELATAAARLESQEEQATATYWTNELQARKYGRVFEDLWDSINHTTNKLQPVVDFPCGEIQLPDWGKGEPMPHNISLFRPQGPGQRLPAPDWSQLLRNAEAEGWSLVQCEFRHTGFDPPGFEKSARSAFSFSAHLDNRSRNQRAVIEGDLSVEWASTRASNQLEPTVQPQRIDATRVALKTRTGEPPFREILREEITPEPGTFFIDPLLLYDLDGDGLPEIILAAKNLVYRRIAGGTYASSPLCRFAPGLIFTGIIADFDGDGFADFLCAKFEGLMLFKGSPQGTFDEPGQLAWTAPQHLRYVNALTCGDVDGDGALDVFVTQYKLPYLHGAMPTPYYDANDGYPAFLLANDGQGHFRDITSVAGLDHKRFRRCYSTSLVDLNDDHRLDLVVVSDFAGLDLYQNDGQGRFTDVTSSWVGETHAFGMGHAVADFNSDGRLDLLMLGMPSAAVDRLDHAHAWRSESGEQRSMRSRMSHGNRLYIARDTGTGLQQLPLGDAVARSGWSWGCSAADFDNDGWPDLYIANGHESKESVRDYDSEFWLHDIYVASSSDNPITEAYFNRKTSQIRGQGISYGGYDKNRLYLNLQGTNFFEGGFLLGVGLEQDSRSVVSDDLDGDGRIDLLVTTFEVWPQFRQTLRVFRNELPGCGGWIGFRLRERVPGKSPVGVQAVLESEGRTARRALLTGDSYRAQHANCIYFGLGRSERVRRVLFKWPSGNTVVLEDPAINRYHSIQAPQ